MALRFGTALPASLDQLRFEPRPQRIRVHRAGQPVADTTDGLLVWEPRRVVPVYAVPWRDFSAQLERAGRVEPDLAALPPVMGPEKFPPHTTPGDSVTVTVAGKRISGAAMVCDDPDLASHVILDFGSFEWLEEDTVAIGHPHDPFKRIDVLASSRHVQVALDGVLLADTSRAMMLLETHLPARWYIPPDDVRLDLLAPSDGHTVCAYKGRASYFHYLPAGRAGRNIAWTYPDPLFDGLRVKDLVCFFVERTDTSLDGVLEERPVTVWSEPW